MKQTEATGLKRYLNDEVKFIVYVLGIGFGIISPYFGVKQDIALMQRDIATINVNIQAILLKTDQLSIDQEKDEKAIAILQTKVNLNTTTR